MKVAVLRGGRSSEHEISLRSGSAVADGLRAGGHDVREVLIERDGAWRCDGAEVEMTPGGGLLGCEVAFPVLHGPGGEDGSVQGLLECLDVPYVGSDVEASAICLDKLAFKRLLAADGIPQVDFAEARGDGWLDRAAGLGLPQWVKPARLGSSVGITKVEASDELEPAVEAARRHDPKVIIEASGPGKEVECSLLGHGEVIASVPGEIVAHADWYDYEAKYGAGGMELVIPARIADEIRERVRSLALEAFRRAGCAGLARADFFVESDGRVLVNELNTIPGFTPMSVFAKLFEASGVPYPELVDRLVRLAVERHEAERAYRF
jgi:D-alanine-D-alanine ligase